MKLIIDTNVLISAILKDGKPEKLILWVIKNNHQWIVTDEILTEYFEVLKRKKFNLSDEIITYWEDLINITSIKITTKNKFIFNRDKKDEKFIECLIESKSDYFIMTIVQIVIIYLKCFFTTCLLKRTYKKFIIELKTNLKHFSI